jgi:hypothetical protein
MRSQRASRSRSGRAAEVGASSQDLADRSRRKLRQHGETVAVQDDVRRDGDRGRHAAPPFSADMTGSKFATVAQWPQPQQAVLSGVKR